MEQDDQAINLPNAKFLGKSTYGVGFCHPLENARVAKDMLQPPPKNALRKRPGVFCFASPSIPAFTALSPALFFSFSASFRPYVDKEAHCCALMCMKGLGRGVTFGLGVALGLV